MKNTITFKRVWQQLKADLIGKDSYRGITLTYAWLANQFGHISLGFIPSFLLYRFTETDDFYAALYVSAAWLLFEIYNFLGPLLSKKESDSEVVFIPKNMSYKFEPKWGNVAFDTFTDVCFFTFGAFLFSLTINEGENSTVIIVLIVLIVLFVYLLFASRYWFMTKMYQFYARFPFQFRLSQWDFDIHIDHKKKVDQFLKSIENEGSHLLIYGDFGTGKTSLGVGILNELSIKHNSCLYKNGIKMFNSFFDDAVVAPYEIWNWRTADFLMIDDINPSKPIENELVSPQKLLSFIDTMQSENKTNRDTLIRKNVIWILGSKSTADASITDKWEQLLLEIGVDERKISTINLSK